VLRELEAAFSCAEDQSAGHVEPPEPQRFRFGISEVVGARSRSHAVRSAATATICTHAWLMAYSREGSRPRPVSFAALIQIAKGTYFRWIGDDDWLAPDFVSRTLECFAEDEGQLIVTTRIEYTSPDGVTSFDDSYDGALMASHDPVERLTEMMRLLNESYLLIDPLYGLVRREPVAAISRRNILREDEVFAAKLALTGPWGHVPLTLAGRNAHAARLSQVARRLGVPGWQAHVATSLQCIEVLHWIGQSELDEDQKRKARATVHRMYLRRQTRTYMHRGRKLWRMAVSAIRHEAF
jgi:hypothetical protein